MRERIGMATRGEVIRVLEQRYRTASRPEKGRILDELVAVSGLHRKHAIRLLARKRATGTDLPRHTRRIYDEAVQSALQAIWETADRICGKRLKPILPTLLAALEGHGYLQLDRDVRRRVLAVSAATIDRMLAGPRAAVDGRRKRRKTGPVGRQVPIRTFAGWNDPVPGFCEMDFVVHSGGSMSGRPIHTLVLTDIASGWTECLSLLVRDQQLVVEALDVLRLRLPIALRGLDCDNDSAFLNPTLIAYCAENDLEFTRCRAGRKNDQAWIEQKNGAVVRRLAGYQRFEGVRALQVLRRLFTAAHGYVNFFQPSFKLREKVREGGRVRKRYAPPATPGERLLADPRVSDEAKAWLESQRVRLDPVVLLKEIRDAQAELAHLGNPTAPSSAPLDLREFVRLLPELWREGEVRATHRRKAPPVRDWRTREDPFADVWPEVLGWLEREPERTGKEMFARLTTKHPDRFAPGQLRTLQRRIREWRGAMARRLLLPSVAEPED